MSLICMEGFENLSGTDLKARYINSVGSVYAGGTGPSGATRYGYGNYAVFGGWPFAEGFYVYNPNPGGVPRCVVQAAIHWQYEYSAPRHGGPLLMVKDRNNIGQLTLMVTDNLGLAIYTGDAWSTNPQWILAAQTPDYQFPFNAWSYFEFQFDLGHSGSAVMRVNGRTIMDQSGLDLQYAPTAEFGNVSIGGSGPYFGIPLDDVIVMNGDGADLNTLIGDHRILVYSPVEDAQTDWTPLVAGDHYVQVDEATQDGDTSYVATHTIGATDTYRFMQAAGLQTIAAVELTSVARKDNPGVRIVAPVLSGLSDHVGTDVYLADSYVPFGQIYESNIDVAAPWTVANLNALRFGAKLTG